MTTIEGAAIPRGSGGREAETAQRTRRGRTSLRLRLIALAALGLALLMGERVSAIVNDHDEQLRTVRQHVLDLADRGIAQYSQTVASVTSTLQVLTLDAGGMLANPDTCDRLNAIVEMEPALASLSIIAPDGTVGCSSNPAARWLDLSDREYVQIALRGAFNLSSVVRGLLSSTPNIIAAQPAIADDGTVTAIVMGRIELDSLFPLSIISALDLNATVLMVDPRGNALIAYPDSQLAGTDLSRLPVIEAMLSRSAGTVVGLGPDGVERIYGYRRLPGSNIRLAVGIDMAQAKAPLEAATWRAVTTFVAACALIFIGLWFAGERLVVRPVRMLSARFARFGRGEGDDVREPTPDIIELQPLITAFSAMARQLTQRELALRDANSQLLALASLDPLTGVANRRAFDQHLTALWNGRQATLAMIMVDIDCFKMFNDRYGHGEGDGCLRRVAAALAAAVRGSDIVARLGGEEFAVLMPGADAAVAGEVAARLRTAVEALAIPHEGVPPDRVTVSLGYAACRTLDGRAPTDLLEAADRALYEAKRAGRNTVRRGELAPANGTAAPLMLRRG